MCRHAHFASWKIILTVCWRPERCRLDAVAQVHAIAGARSLRWPMMNREDDASPLAKLVERPFNRAFKADTGRTPTEFRRMALTERQARDGLQGLPDRNDNSIS
jgi:hypothetical protein